MSDTAETRLSLARAAMHEADAHLNGALEVFEDGSKPLPSDFQASAEDAHLVARHLTLAGEHETAADLLRRVEG